MARRGIRLAGLGAERVLGALVAMARIGPAARQPFAYRVLQWIGVLDKLPWSWPDSSHLDAMPWGGLNDDRFTRVQLPQGIEGLWPQSPVVHDAFSAPVLNLARADRGEHLRYNVTRYLGQVVRLTPGAGYRALRGPRLVPIDDAEFARQFEDTSLGQFICPILDAPDRELFAGLIPPGQEASYMKVDFSGMAHVGAPLPGVYIAPTVSLLRSLGDGAFRFEAIAFGSKLFKPGDGPSWTLAKYFVLQAAQAHLILIVHPRLHFPQDTVNALTRTLLPQGHLVAKLLRPHGEFTLGLHEAVIHHRRSVLHNSQREIYTPFALQTRGTHQAVALGMKGLAGNSAYPAFRFGDFLPGVHTRYGRYRREWFDAVYAFASAVVAPVPRGDPYVAAWADHISAWLPGFPGAAAIFEGDALARAAADYICAVSVFHTGDHHSLCCLALNTLPLRLRVPPPDVQAPQAIDLDAMVSREDFFRHILGNAMFFKPVVIRNLREARYDFKDAAASSAEAKFRAAMDTLDARWAGTTFPRSGQIAVSTHY